MNASKILFIFLEYACSRLVRCGSISGGSCLEPGPPWSGSLTRRSGSHPVALLLFTPLPCKTFRHGIGRLEVDSIAEGGNERERPLCSGATRGFDQTFTSLNTLPNMRSVSPMVRRGGGASFLCRTMSV